MSDQLTDNTIKIDNSGDEPLSNFSDNTHFYDVLQTFQTSRRHFLKGGLGLATSAFLSSGVGVFSAAGYAATRDQQAIGFAAIPTSRADTVSVPKGYSVKPFVPWGTPLLNDAPDYRADASNSGADQELQVGSHHDGMHFFPITTDKKGKNIYEGLLVMNHEYVDVNVLHTNGPTLGEKRPAEQIRKEIAAHGVSVIHIAMNADGEWSVLQNSRYNRRITGATVMDIRGPARGFGKLSTRFNSEGLQTRGTLNNCAYGVTPWNTYLTAEENWAGYFVNRDKVLPREHARYGVATDQSRYHWERADNEDDNYLRFNATATGKKASDDFRNEPNTFGWMVEIDPFAPESVPQKRTALGRFAHEGVVFAAAEKGKPVVCYSGDDARNEYIYKFVSAEVYDPETAGGHLLDEGTLYVAKFNDNGSGEWLPLDITNAEFKKKMHEANLDFSSQADVLVNTRLAADLVGATKMDRPEWGAVHPDTGEVYFTLTNNIDRTEATVNPANPRANNTTGHIIRWREHKGVSTSNQFTWDIFLLAGDVGTKTPGTEGRDEVVLTERNHFASPDGLWFDANRLLWIQTDMSGTQHSDGPFGNNQMLVADPVSGELRRFLVGPNECEVTGITATPDMKVLFVNIQHPGESSLPNKFTSHWPEGKGARPRSATVIITKDDGGIIGS